MNSHIKRLLPLLSTDGPERRAVESGQIDAIIDYKNSNVILFPAARRALRAAAAADADRGASIANGLLAALPRSEYQRLLPGLEPLTLKVGQALYEPGQPVDYVYFPVDCAVCLFVTAERSEAMGIGLVGRDGMVGVSAALPEASASARAVVLATGTALRITAARFRAALPECPGLQGALRHHTHLRLTSTRQAVGCSRFHAIDARLATGLLMTDELLPLDAVPLTQVTLGRMLGVRRAMVNESAVHLQRRGLIAYSRGRVNILNRRGLQAAACACYVNRRSAA